MEVCKVACLVKLQSLLRIDILECGGVQSLVKLQSWLRMDMLKNCLSGEVTIITLNGYFKVWKGTKLLVWWWSYYNHDLIMDILKCGDVDES